MKKKIISMFLLLTILFSTCMVALAEEDDAPSIINSVSTASLLKSKGAIVYQNGTDSVVIDSNDLYTLADAFDNYKAAIYWQMAEMNTYLTTEDEGIALTSSEDVHVVHSVHPEMDIVAPLSLNFDTLIEGVAASQSIPQAPVEYGYAEGTNLYKTAEGLLTTEASDNTEMIEINGAVADSMSAGTAAWIDGELVLGMGSDNKAYYDKGYTDGFNKVMDGAHISYVYHEHIGDADSGGGCYTKAVYSNGVGRFGWYISSYQSDGHPNVSCNSCRIIVTNFRYEQIPSGMSVQQFLDQGYHVGCPNAPKGIIRYDLNCGKTTSTIESATITFN